MKKRGSLLATSKLKRGQNLKKNRDKGNIKVEVKVIYGKELNCVSSFSLIAFLLIVHIDVLID